MLQHWKFTSRSAYISAAFRVILARKSFHKFYKFAHTLNSKHQHAVIASRRELLHFMRAFYRQHCAQRKPAGISFTQRPILRFFAPQGRHVAPIGVKFAKFHPHRCNDKGVGPPKLKFLLRFDRNVEYKRPAGAYPLRDFHKICSV